MPSVFAKLNLKHQRRILVLDPPASFEPELAALRGVTVVRSLKDAEEVPFTLAFVTQVREVAVRARAIAGKSSGDAIVWFAYPKGTSKRYKSEISRGRGWQALTELGFDTVRSVAIDEDWTALRFRRIEFIQRLT